MPTYGYDKKTDYQKLMNEAVKSGDYARAAIYEQQRNEKIKGEGLSQYQTTNQYSAFLPGSQKFDNPYKADLDAAISRLQDKSAYEKSYLREADRTMEDTLAQYGTMTGGLPSTQAIAAASQAADYYKSQLPEKLADLDRQNVNLLLSASGQAQSEYQAMISQALTRWSQLGFADDHVSQILGVAPGTPTSDQSYINWQKGQQDKADAYTMAMTWLQAGQMPGADILAAAGITATDAQSYLNWQKGQTDKVEQDAERERAYELTMMMLQNGIMPSDAVLSASGLSAEDAKKIYQFANGASSSSYGGGSSSSSSSKGTTAKALPNTEWNKLAQLYSEGQKSGDLTEFERYMSMKKAQGYDVDTFSEWALGSYKDGAPGLGGGAAAGALLGIPSQAYNPQKQQTQQGGVDYSKYGVDGFSDFYNRLGTMSNAEIEALMDRIDSTEFSEAQWKMISELMEKRGI